MEFLETTANYEAHSQHHILYYLDFNHSGKETEKENLNLVLRSKFVELANVRVSSKIGGDQINDIQSLHGFDPTDMLTSVLHNEMKQTKIKMLYKKYLDLAKDNYEGTLTNREKALKWFFPKINFFIYLKDNRESIQKLVYKIHTEASKIGSRGRRGNADFIICSPKIGSLLQESPQFIFRNLQVVKENDIIYNIGQIAGISVFVNLLSKMDDPYIIIGRKTAIEEPGVMLVEKSPEILSKEEITQEGNQKILELNQLISITETSWSRINFNLIKVSFKKKPWWKYILGIK